MNGDDICSVGKSITCCTCTDGAEANFNIQLKHFTYALDLFT